MPDAIKDQMKETFYGSVFATKREMSKKRLSAHLFALHRAIYFDVGQAGDRWQQLELDLIT